MLLHMTNLAIIAAGGAVGAVLRYVVSVGIHRMAGTGFPWGTLTVNLLGCLVIGLVWGASERMHMPAEARLFVFAGLLGAFTTFSTFGLETMNLFRDGQVGVALAYVTASNGAGIGAVALGFFVSRLLLGGSR